MRRKLPKKICQIFGTEQLPYKQERKTCKLIITTLCKIIPINKKKPPRNFVEKTK